jgi:hypothetical protein
MERLGKVKGDELVVAQDQSAFIRSATGERATRWGVYWRSWCCICFCGCPEHDDRVVDSISVIATFNLMYFRSSLNPMTLGLRWRGTVDNATCAGEHPPDS